MKSRHCLLALCATLVPLTVAAEENAFEILGALPDDPQVGIQLEAALVYRDMRLYQRAVEKQRRTLKLTRPGAAFYGAGAQVKAFGFDPFAELVRVLDLAAPQGGAVPAGVVAFTAPTGPGVQLLMKVQPGFLERLAAALASATPPPWPGKVTEETLEIALEGTTFIGRVGQDGWLRMAPDERMLTGGQGKNPFAGTMRKWTDDLDGMIFIQGGGMATSMLAAESGSPLLSKLIESMRAGAFGWKFDGDRTWLTRVLVDIPQLAEMREVARQPELNNSLARVWDDDTAGFLSLSLPPPVTAALVPLAERELANSGAAVPEALMNGLAELDGRIGLVTFDSPGDWAAGIGFRNATTAKSMVPALQQWLDLLGKELDADFSENYVLESLPGAGNLLHMRPDVGLEGWRVASVENTLLITTKSRLSTLSGHARARAAKKPEAPKVAGPVTPPIRAALDTPAMILGYLILTSEGGLFDYLAWSASSLEQIWNKLGDKLPRIELVPRLLDRVPTYLALEGITWSMMYDMALWADLQDSVLVFQLFNSEI